MLVLGADDDGHEDGDQNGRDEQRVHGSEPFSDLVEFVGSGEELRAHTAELGGARGAVLFQSWNRRRR